MYLSPSTHRAGSVVAALVENHRSSPRILGVLAGGLSTPPPPLPSRQPAAAGRRVSASRRPSALEQGADQVPHQLEEAGLVCAGGLVVLPNGRRVRQAAPLVSLQAVQERLLPVRRNSGRVTKRDGSAR